MLEERANAAHPADFVLLREALDLALTALLIFDAQRFQFQRELDRLVWSENIAQESIRAAFRLATRLSDATTVADLISSIRAAGIITLSLADTPDSRVSTSVLASIIPTFDHTSEYIDSPAAAASAATAPTTAALGLEALFTRAPLPDLLMPNGRTALRPYRTPQPRQAHYR